MAAAFLSNKKGINLSPADICRGPTELTERIANVLEEVGMVFDQVLSAVIATVLLIAHNSQYDITSNMQVLGFCLHEGSKSNAYLPLQFQQTPPPPISTVPMP